MNGIPLIVAPTEAVFRHPGRRVSDDEMHGRGLVDLKDPTAKLPKICSVGRHAPAPGVPMQLRPVSRKPRDLVRSYLYESICADCARKRR